MDTVLTRTYVTGLEEQIKLKFYPKSIPNENLFQVRFLAAVFVDDI